jgi:hypothetical protein
MRAGRRTLVVIGVLVLLGSRTPGLSVQPQTPVTTVTGCVERDAASRAPIFKLIVPQPDGGSRIYQLSAPASVDLPAVVGKTAEVSGTVTVEKRARRDVHVLTIKTLKVVSDRCG